MPQVIETKSAPDANSYATADEFDAFVDSLYGVADEVGELTQPDKERLLLTATNMIERLIVAFDKLDPAQALKFPTATDPDGFATAKAACLIQALYLFLNSDVIREAEQGTIQGTKSEGLGPATRTVTGFNSRRVYDPEVFRLLSPYLVHGIKIKRG